MRLATAAAPRAAQPEPAAETAAGAAGPSRTKGAISAQQAEEYRRSLETTGRFPKLLRHTLLRMSPRPVHRALYHGRYALRLVTNIRAVSPASAGPLPHGYAASPMWPGGFWSETFRMLMSRKERLRRCHAEMSRWIEQEQQLGRLSPARADRLHEAFKQDEIADLLGLFIIHTLIGALKQSILGPSVLWLAAAAAAGRLWLADPALVSRRYSGWRRRSGSACGVGPRSCS